MRSAKEQEYFPYTGGTVCYIEVGKDGEVAQMHHKNKSDLPEVLRPTKEWHAVIPRYTRSGRENGAAICS